MKVDDLRARLDAVHARMTVLINHAGAPGTGELRCAQLNDGIAELLDEQAALWRDLAEGRIEITEPLSGEIATLLVRAARKAAEQAAYVAAVRRDSAGRLRAAARQVAAEGEAAFADDGLEYVPGVGTVRR